MVQLTFSPINGGDVEADDEEARTMVLAPASGRINEAERTALIRSRLASVT